ncbi:MAG: BrnT family toxin [Xenococcus sp. MO_188.B8]|nr:BrnT family toxin [Xenococcus sp. MO_188.B8]
MYEWDDDKNRKNVEKHGIDFETAKRIFDSPIVSRRDERKDYNEIRYVSIGIIDQVAMIVVIHTNRQDRIRLISARPASRRERRIYYEQIQKTDDS